MTSDALPFAFMFFVVGLIFAANACSSIAPAYTDAFVSGAFVVAFLVGALGMALTVRSRKR